MKVKFAVLLSCTLSAFLLTSCFSDNSKNQSEDQEETQSTFREDDNEEDNINIEIDGEKIDLSGLKESIDELEDKLNDLNDGKKVEITNFRVLKELLPKRVAGMDRTDHEGEKVGAFGFKMSTANAEYEDGDKKAEVSIIDFGGMGSAISSMAAWSLMEVDRESDNGYERTTTIEGHDAYEKYDSRREEGEINILIDKRFIVNIKAWNVSERELNKIRKAIDLDDIQDLG